MSFLFGKKKTFQEQLRDNKRSINRAVRELDREKRKLELEEKKLKTQIRKAAEANQMEVAKIHARDLVRTKAYVQRFTKMRAQLQAVNLRMQMIKSTEAMNGAMTKCGRVMSSINAKMDIPSMQRIMQGFMKENQMLEMKQEMMTDTMDEAFEESEEEEEAEATVNEIFTELGISFGDSLGTAPGGVAAPAQGTEDAFASRLAGLDK
eukprot:gnl/Dysnectes_brevis/757_a832_5365.p1 GENE.gnl/Dysnectes_brevis/757_a832_5365~~gnl/Dysnectes_brevis/757_a832_5365.p1  ORF type:complete len:207 (+),score=85.74 gnl/Dysnectes_brevis/757_a832_5365:67-687(+)